MRLLCTVKNNLFEYVAIYFPSQQAGHMTAVGPSSEMEVWTGTGPNTSGGLSLEFELWTGTGPNTSGCLSLEFKVWTGTGPNTSEDLSLKGLVIFIQLILYCCL